MMLGKRPENIDDDVYIHPLALVESSKIGKGTRIWGFSHVMENAVLGENCNICEQVFIETGATIGDRTTIKNGVQIWDKVHIGSGVFIGPNATFTNDLIPRANYKKNERDFLETNIGNGATVGAGAVIVCGNHIGENAFIAAGAVVTKDVPNHGVVLGNPAKLTGYICKCGKMRSETAENIRDCEECSKLELKWGNFNP